MRKLPNVEGHWHTHIEGFSTSTLDFYSFVKEGIAKRKVPDLQITQVEWQESGLGSAKRVYLRVSRENLNFDICAAPFGNGYFFSWWLARIPRVLLDLGFLLAALVAFGILVALCLKDDQDWSGGCLGFFLAPLLFFALLFGLGASVRYADQGLEPTVLSMPITGFLYQLVFRPVTYFNEDTAIIFRDTVHAAVLEALESFTAKQGLRALAPEERKPMVRNLLG
jgi:hypothetical protein